MPNIVATRDTSMDLESLMNQNNASAATAEAIPASTSAEYDAPPKREMSPLDELASRKGQGYVVNPDEVTTQQVRSGQMRDESIEGVQRELDAMDRMIENAQMVRAQKPTNPIEMAATMEALSELDPEEVRAAKAAAETEDLMESNNGSALGLDLSAESALSVDGKGSLAGGLFRVKGDDSEESGIDLQTGEPMSPERQAKREEHIQVIVDKTGYGSLITFTDDEMEKIRLSTQIDVVQVEHPELKYAKLDTPTDDFMVKIRTDLHKMLGATSEIPLVGSRIRASFRGLTYGEYANLALCQDISKVENFNTRCNTYYNALVSTSIGAFTSYDDFLKHVAAVDMPMMTFGVYVPTNPENMDIGVECRVEGCGNHFRHPFVPRTLLDLEAVSDRFLEIMEKTSTVEFGMPAKQYHQESSLLTRTRILMPKCGIKVDLGLISCYDMINYRLPYLADAEKILTEKYPDDAAGIHALLPSITDTVAGVILTDADGTEVYIDDIVAIADILYNMPYEDYDLLMAITAQSNIDYSYGFVTKNVVCPKCKTKTSRLIINLDDEIFTQLQMRRSTTVNPATLPRL